MFGQYSNTFDGRKTKRDMLERLASEGKTIDPKKAVKIENNTLAYTDENGDSVIRLHNTDIIRTSANGKKITVFTGGWNTVTTRDRLHGHLPFSVYTQGGTLFIRTAKGTFPIGDKPVTFAPTGECLTKRNLASLKTIAGYKLLIKQWTDRAKRGDIADPAGDPWIPLGTLPSKDVALDWLKTGYVTQHAILSALRWAGYQDMALAMAQHDLQKGISLSNHYMSAVRRYFKAALKI